MQRISLEVSDRVRLVVLLRCPSLRLSQVVELSSCSDTGRLSVEIREKEGVGRKERVSSPEKEKGFFFSPSSKKILGSCTHPRVIL